MRLTNKFNLWRKALNHYLIAFQNKVLKNEIVAGLPEYIAIDTTNNCNLRCPLCPTGQNRNEYPRGMMKFETFKKIMDELGIWLYDIYVGNWGEPLLNPELCKMIEYVHECNIRVSVFTNLNVLDGNMAERIVKSKLECLNVSLDGASQESYGKYRKNGDFNMVIDNIKLISEIKKQHNSKFPVIVWQFLAMKHNENEINKAKEMAEELGIQFKLGYVRCDMGNELLMNAKERFENVKEWLPEDEKYSRYNQQYALKNHKQSCDFLWTFAVINWDGGVAPCCGVYKKEDTFGNVSNGSFKSIWNNAKYRESRRLVKSKHPEGNLHAVCENCLKNGFID